MPINTLTDAECRGAKLGPKPQKLFDGEGLHLFVSSTGAKTWRVAYRLAGKPQTLSLGPYPDVTLAQASASGTASKRRCGTGVTRWHPGAPSGPH